MLDYGIPTITTAPASSATGSAPPTKSEAAATPKSAGAAKTAKAATDAPPPPAVAIPYFHHRGISIMYNSFLTLQNGGVDTELDGDVQKYLHQNKVIGVISGHVPNGQCPAPLRARNCLVLPCDTSYSDDTRQAFATVCIYPDLVEVSGKLSNGDRHGFSLPFVFPRDHPRHAAKAQIDDHAHEQLQLYGGAEDPMKSLPVAHGADPDSVCLTSDHLIGRRLKDEYWIRTMLTTSGLLFACKREGRSVLSRSLSFGEAVASLVPLATSVVAAEVDSPAGSAGRGNSARKKRGRKKTK